MLGIQIDLSRKHKGAMHNWQLSAAANCFEPLVALGFERIAALPCKHVNHTLHNTKAVTSRIQHACLSAYALDCLRRFVWFFCALGYLPGYSPAAMAPAIGIVCVVATVVESLPINHWLDDNLSVPGVAVALSLLLLPQTQPAVAAAAVSLRMPGL